MRGEVSNIADFGIFVLLEEGLEGLLHVSELEGAEARTALESIEKGTHIEAEVIYVSERKRRLALRLIDEPSDA